MNSQQLRNVTDKVLSSGSGPLLSYRQDPDGGGYQLDASGVISTLLQPVHALDGGQQRIPVKIHPFVPPGTTAWSPAGPSDLPAQYQSSEVPG